VSDPQTYSFALLLLPLVPSTQPHLHSLLNSSTTINPIYRLDLFIMANAQALSEKLEALHAQLETIEDAKAALDSNSTVCTTMRIV